MQIAVTVNGTRHEADVEPRTLLVYLIRDSLGLTGTNVGCDTSTCGACTVLVDGRRIVSCLALGVQYEGREVTTIEGIGPHPLQDAFVRFDGLQCGYCTPGQICSAIGMLAEHERGAPSAASDDVTSPGALTRKEIRERMSGNLCRCGAYNGIVDAIESMGGESA